MVNVTDQTSSIGTKVARTEVSEDKDHKLVEEMSNVCPTSQNKKWNFDERENFRE